MAFGGVEVFSEDFFFVCLEKVREALGKMEGKQTGKNREEKHMCGTRMYLEYMWVNFFCKQKCIF